MLSAISYVCVWCFINIHHVVLIHKRIRNEEILLFKVYIV